MAKSIVKRSVIQLQRDIGPVFPIAEILTANPEVTKDEVITALAELKEEGLITLLDEDTVQVNI